MAIPPRPTVHEHRTQENGECTEGRDSQDNAHHRSDCDAGRGGRCGSHGRRGGAREGHDGGRGEGRSGEGLVQLGGDGSHACDEGRKVAWRVLADWVLATVYTTVTPLA